MLESEEKTKAVPAVEGIVGLTQVIIQNESRRVLGEERVDPVRQGRDRSIRRKAGEISDGVLVAEQMRGTQDEIGAIELQTLESVSSRNEG